MKSHSVSIPYILLEKDLQYLKFNSTKRYNHYLFSKAEGKTKLNQVILRLCLRSLRQRKAFNF